MAVTLNASTSSGFIATSDTSGSLELQANGTTKATVGSTGLSIGQYNPAASLITSGTAVNSTSGTSIDFTSIPSWVKRVTVMFSGVNTNGSSGVQVQLGTSSGVTTSGYTVYFIQAGGSAAQALSSTGFSTYPNSVTNAVRQGTFVFTNITGNTWVGTINTAFVYAGVYYSSGGAGNIALAATLDRVRITTGNGTDAFNAGTINILYE